jgi:hypothetical protein
MKAKLIIILIFFSYPAGLIFSQTGQYYLNVFKDNLSWNWLGQIQWESSSQARSHFYFDNQFTSHLFLETVRDNKWRDENNLNTFWSYKISSKYRTTSKIKSQIFSDDNTTLKFSKHIIFQEFDIIPKKEISISPSLGWASEDIFNFRDQGLYSQLKLDVRSYDLGGYSTSTNGFTSLFFYPDRKNQEHRYFLSFRKRFSEQASDSFQVGYELVDNSYPLPPGVDQQSKELEDVGINSRYLYNDLSYQISANSIFQVETKIQDRDITQSNFSLHNHRQELNLANRIGIRYSGRRILSAFAFTTSQITTLASRRPVGSDEARTDIDGLQSAFNLLFNWRMDPANEMHLSFSYTKFEYSSPDTTQTIDEDNIRFIVDALYRHRFSEYLSFYLNAYIYLYHQIYIHPTRSANNNWNRIYQLSPSFIYQLGETLENKYQLRILANYTVFDFEDILPEVRSYLLRTLVFTDTLKLRMSRGMKFQLVYQLEREDNGTFFKDVFAQQISRELLSHLFDIGLIYYRIAGFELATALNWYVRKEWAYSPEKILIRDYYAFGPRLTILYKLGRKLQLFGTFSPRTYNDLNIKRQYFSLGRINLRYLF